MVTTSTTLPPKNTVSKYPFHNPKYTPTGILKAESITRMIDIIQRDNLQPAQAARSLKPIVDLTMSQPTS